MDVIPAIDLMKGRVVRLRKGDPDTPTIYHSFRRPLQAAVKWEREGAKTLHIIDLDAAMDSGDNLEIVSSIIQGISVPVQVGGGIRSKTIAETMFNIGAQKVIVATMAFHKTEELKELLELYGPRRIMVALDYLGDKVMVKGWRSSTGLTLKKAVEKFCALGVKAFLITSISKDGILQGPDYSTLKDVSEYEVDIFAAGGIESLEDLLKLKEMQLEGVIIGRALYEKKFSLREAIELIDD